MTNEEAKEAIYVMMCLRTLTAKEDEALHVAFLTLERLESSWIPCSERLPERDVEVLVTTGAWRIHIATKCFGDGWLTDESNFYDDDDIIAWMPLPAPYKREKTDAEIR